jgi:hypothetical protein
MSSTRIIACALAAAGVRLGAITICGVGLLNAVPAQADTFNFTSCHISGGCGTATQFGTVTLTQSGTSVNVDVILNSGNRFVETAAGGGSLFLFNDSIAGSTITGISATLNGALVAIIGGLTGLTNQSPIFADGTGTWTAQVFCTDSSQCNGGSTPNINGLRFSVTNATVVGLTTANSLGLIFAADILCGQTGCTGIPGPVAATVAPNMPPTANAGPDQSFDIVSGRTVHLDGTASHDDNTPAASLGYNWFQISGPAASLNGTNTATPSFTPTAVGTYIFGLVVTDTGVPPLSSPTPSLAAGASTCVPASSCVTVSAFNQPPTAVATASTTIPFVGESVRLDGTQSSDPEGDAISYVWSLTMKPMGSNASLAPPSSTTTSTTSIVPDVPGTYKVTLTVNDGFHSPVPLLPSGQVATVTVVASSDADFADTNINDASHIVQGLSISQVTSKGNQKDLIKLLRQAESEIQKGHYCKAVEKLNQAISRTDGFPLRNALDVSGEGRDWITDAAAQTAVYADLSAARAAITGLPCGIPPGHNHDEDDPDDNDD